VISGVFFLIEDVFRIGEYIVSHQSFVRQTQSPSPNMPAPASNGAI